MADRRMLAKTIIESDHFAEMPAETQMLYVRLNLAADDDGFVANPRQIMRSCGAGDDSMKMLIAKKFVLSFKYNDNFVYLIKHWKVHNYIQKDRYKASAFKELLREVYYDENKAYSMTPGREKKPVLPPDPYTDCIQDVSKPDAECIQDVSKMDNQVRLGKSKDRVSLEEGKDRGRKEESEGKTPQFDLSDPDPLKISRIKHWKKRIDFMREMGQEPGGMYDLAKIEGITADDIDNFKEA